MKLLLINFSPRKNGCCQMALGLAKEEIIKLGAEAKILNVNTSVGSCLACGACKGGGGCVSDAVNMLAEEASAHDGFIFATPTHYGKAVQAAFSMLSRLLYSNMPSVYGKPAFALATARRGGGFGAISDIELFFKFAAMPTANSAYPCIVYSRNPDDFQKDKEGHQNVVCSAKNLVWLTKSLLLAKNEGLEIPAPGKRIKTDISGLIQ